MPDQPGRTFGTEANKGSPGRLQQRPDPADKGQHQERIAGGGQRRRGRQQGRAPEDHASRDDKQRGGHERGEAHPQGECLRRADHDQCGRPKRDAADIGRHAGLKPRRIAGHQQGLAGQEGQEAGRYAIIAQPLVFHRQQRGGDHESHAVDRPERFAQRRAGDEGAGQPEGAAARPTAAVVSDVVRI